MNEIAEAIRKDERATTVARCVAAVEQCKVQVDVIGKNAYGQKVITADPLSLRQYDAIIKAIKAVADE